MIALRKVWLWYAIRSCDCKRRWIEMFFSRPVSVAFTVWWLMECWYVMGKHSRSFSSISASNKSHQEHICRLSFRSYSLPRLFILESATVVVKGTSWNYIKHQQRGSLIHNTRTSYLHAHQLRTSPSKEIVRHVCVKILNKLPSAAIKGE